MIPFSSHSGRGMNGEKSKRASGHFIKRDTAAALTKVAPWARLDAGVAWGNIQQQMSDGESRGDGKSLDIIGEISDSQIACLQIVQHNTICYYNSTLITYPIPLFDKTGVGGPAEKKRGFTEGMVCRGTPVYKITNQHPKKIPEIVARPGRKALKLSEAERRI